MFKFVGNFAGSVIHARSRVICLCVMASLAACTHPSYRYAREEPPSLSYSDFALNWDGTKIAFDFRNPGAKGALSDEQIAVLDIASGDVRTIKGPSRVFTPSFSPSGRYLAFVAHCLEFFGSEEVRCPEGQLGSTIAIYDFETEKVRVLPSDGTHYNWRPTYGVNEPPKLSRERHPSSIVKAMPIFSHDEAQIYYLSGYSNPSVRGVYGFSPRVIDLRTEEDRFVLDEADDALHFGRYGTIAPSGPDRYAIFGRRGYDGAREAEYLEQKAFGFFLNTAHDLEEEFLSGIELVYDPRYRGIVNLGTMPGTNEPQYLSTSVHETGSYLRRDVVFTLWKEVFLLSEGVLTKIAVVSDFDIQKLSGIALSGDGRKLLLVGPSIDAQTATLDVWLLDMDTGERESVRLPPLSPHGDSLGVE